MPPGGHTHSTVTIYHCRTSPGGPPPPQTPRQPEVSDAPQQAPPYLPVKEDIFEKYMYWFCLLQSHEIVLQQAMVFMQKLNISIKFW